MKSLKLAVLPLMTLLAVPAEAAPRVKVILPEKTKNTCIRKVARLSSTLKYEAALAELAAPGCTQDLGTAEQLWVSLMEGVLYQALEQTPQAEEAFCRAFKQEELASLPIEKPSAGLDELFEKMRVECPDRNKAKVEQAAAEAAAAAAPAPVVEAAPPPPAEPPPPVVEPEPALSLVDSFELYASVHGEADVGSSGPLPLAGVNVNGSVRLPFGLRAGVGLTALGSPRFSSAIGLLLADVRLAYPVLASPGGFGLQVFASGGPLMYGPSPLAAGGRAGLGVAMDVSKVRVSLGGSYEWRSHYRLDYAAPMAWLEVGWKLAGK
ncbi:hypothetical protein ATI61_107535 [Archangium gephyra]|uniref:Uncharacterized protein n=1 Tax=Archangium gephyra TaxID=48 RepID=A0AAC8TJB3_9BACT|nr:hypothetical protein [Archangium gephyra]AKJ08102.1 Hypothetical protein AA314_09728 [Archangium gephyra]REG29838.1 hypothetical protein ATI61_107535 [Archangium gephyra]